MKRITRQTCPTCGRTGIDFALVQHVQGDDESLCKVDAQGEFHCLTCCAYGPRQRAKPRRAPA